MNFVLYNGVNKPRSVQIRVRKLVRAKALTSFRAYEVMSDINIQGSAFINIH
jgi:hypothetical protein